MPATCFNCLPRGAGAIAQRCRLSLQGLSEAWLALRALSAVRSELCARRATNASTGVPHGVWHRCLRPALPSLLAC